jgi:alpha-glucosidase
MQWRDAPGAGFTTPGVTPWLPFGDTARANVASQRDDPGSLLTLTRALIALRRSDADLQRGAYESVAAADGVWSWRRGEHALVAINMSERPATLEGVSGRLLIGTEPARVGERLAGTVRLGAWEAVIAELDSSLEVGMNAATQRGG